MPNKCARSLNRLERSACHNNYYAVEVCQDIIDSEEGRAAPENVVNRRTNVTDLVMLTDCKGHDRNVKTIRQDRWEDRQQTGPVSVILLVAVGGNDTCSVLPRARVGC